MFGRIVEFTPKPEMKDEIVNVLGKEVLPILKKQQGFMEFLPFVPETKTEKWIAVSLWAEKRDVDRWEREGYPNVEGILKLYLVASAVCNHYKRGNLPLQALGKSPDDLRSDTSGRNSPLVLLATNDASILFGSPIVVELVSRWQVRCEHRTSIRDCCH